MVTEARRLAELLPAISPSETTAMDSSAPSTVNLDLSLLNNLPARLDDQMLGRLQAILDCPETPEPPCDRLEYTEIMRMLSILPRKADDELTGELRQKLYRRMLRSQTQRAMQWLGSQALLRCQWFPTIKECLDIIADMPGGLSDLAKAKRIAAARIRWENQARFDEVMERLRERSMPQDEIDALPDYYKRVGETRSYLRLQADGRYVAWGEK